MHDPTLTSVMGGDIGQHTAAFYRHVLEALRASPVPFLVGGAYAFHHYTGISRHTKDLDIFIRQTDYEKVSAILLQAGHKTELTYPHWLAKASLNEDFIDLIFSSGNGIAKVDDEWFQYASTGLILDVPVTICPIEEMMWSKAFVMERERFDGADIVHLLRSHGKQLDWQRLLRRFAEHWRILLSHLTLFGYVYPDHRDAIPEWVLEALLDRLRGESHAPLPHQGICQGTLLSREQYLTDIKTWGYHDARLQPIGNMTPEETQHWTNAINRAMPQTPNKQN